MDLHKLEEERQIMKGNWGNRKFINAFDVMLENSKNFESEIDEHDQLSSVERKYQIIESLGKTLKSALDAGMDVTEIFSMYQVLSWSKGEDKSV